MNNDDYNPFRFGYNPEPQNIERPLVVLLEVQPEEQDPVSTAPVQTKNNRLIWLIAISLFSLWTAAALSGNPSNSNRALPPPLGVQGKHPQEKPKR